MTARIEEAPETQGLADLELDLILEGIRRRYGLDLDGVDRDYLRRRIRSRLRGERLGSPLELLGRLLREPASFSALLGPGEEVRPRLFRPAGIWKTLRERVLAPLRTYPSVRVWIPGSAAADLATLVILLEEELSRPYRVYATEPGEVEALRSRFGRLRPEALDGPAYAEAGGRARLRDHFEDTPDGPVLSKSLQRRVVFGTHHPATDGSFNEFHLILLRRLLPAWSAPHDERHVQVLDESLIRFGFLMVAPSKSSGLRPPVPDSCRPILRRAGLYQKVSQGGVASR